MNFNGKNSVRVQPISTIRVGPYTDSHQSPNAKKMNSSKKYNFARTMQPIYIISRTFGLFPFTIIHDLNGDIQGIRVTFFDLLWFLISISIYILLAIYNFCYLKFPQNTNVSEVLYIGDYLLLILGLIFGAALIASDMYNRFNLADIAMQFTKFDKKVIVFCNFVY